MKIYLKQQDTDPSAPAATDKTSINAAANTKAIINLRIHLTSSAAQTVPASGLER